jgi:hypothetical protein
MLWGSVTVTLDHDRVCEWLRRYFEGKLASHGSCSFSGRDIEESIPSR